MPLNPDLLEILICPQCKGSIEASPDQAWLICRKCRLQYEVRDGIPVMLVDEARPLEE